MQFGVWFQLPPDERPQELKQESFNTALGGTAVLMTALIMFFNDYSGPTIGLTCSLLAAVLVAIRLQSNKDVLDAVRHVCAEHQQSLTQRRAEVTRIDAYGVTDQNDWEEEKYYFYVKVIKPALEAKKLKTALSQGMFGKISQLIDEAAPFTPDLQKPIYLR